MRNNLPDHTFGPFRALIMSKRALHTALALGLTLPLLAGCSGAALISGVAAGAAIVHERRATRALLEDEYLEHLAIRQLTDNPDIAEHSRITVTSYNHLVLLTGQAEARSFSDRFAQLVARLPKVRRVINEVTIEPMVSLAREGRDTLITSRVKLALTKIDIPGFDTTRVKVITEAGTVFLMGLVYPREGQAAAEKARYVPDVTKVVKVFEYIEL